MEDQITIRQYDQKEERDRRPLQKGERLYRCVTTSFSFGRKVVAGHFYCTSSRLEDTTLASRFRLVRVAENAEATVTSQSRAGFSHPLGHRSSPNTRPGIEHSKPAPR